MRFSIAKLGCAHLYTWLAYHAYAPSYTRLYCIMCIYRDIVPVDAFGIRCDARPASTDCTGFTRAVRSP